MRFDIGDRVLTRTVLKQRGWSVKVPAMSQGMVVGRTETTGLFRVTEYLVQWDDVGLGETAVGNAHLLLDGVANAPRGDV